VFARRITYRVHAIQRMFERYIGIDDIEYVLSTGEVIEEYPDDEPYPSRLLLGVRRGRTLHVVVADNAQDNEVIVITAYEPDPEKWDSTFRLRKKQ